MKYVLVIFLAFAAAVAIVGAPVYAVENEYGSARMFFNDVEIDEQNAGQMIMVRAGESFRVRLLLESKVDGSMNVALVNLMSAYDGYPYDVEEGPTLKMLPKAFDAEEYEPGSGNWVVYDVQKGWTKTLEWRIAPKGDYKGEGAPLEFYIQVFDSEGRSDFIILPFLRLYITDEGGSATENRAQANEDNETGTPSYYAYMAVIGAAALIAFLALRK